MYESLNIAERKAFADPWCKAHGGFVVAKMGKGYDYFPTGMPPHTGKQKVNAEIVSRWFWNFQEWRREI